MGCFNNDKLQSINQFEGKIGPRPTEVLKYPQGFNLVSYFVTPYNDAPNCVYGLMYNAGDLNSAGGAEADSTTTLNVFINLDPNYYESISGAPTTIISPFATEDQLTECEEDDEIECPTISSEVNIGSLKARYILIDTSQASVNSIVDNGYTEINNSRMGSTNIDGEYLVFITGSFFQGGTTTIKGVYVYADNTTLGSCTIETQPPGGFIMNNSSMAGGQISSAGLQMFDSLITDTTIASLNGLTCFNSTIKGILGVVQQSAAGSSSSWPPIHLINQTNYNIYNNYECVPNTTTIDENGQEYCIKALSLTDAGPLREKAAVLVDYLDDIADSIQEVKRDTGDPLLNNASGSPRVQIINSMIEGNCTIDNAFGDNALIINTVFSGCNANINYIYSPKEQNNIISNVSNVTLTAESELTCIQLKDLYIDNSSVANIIAADSINNYGTLAYEFSFLQEFMQNGSDATVNFTSESTALGGFNSVINFNGGTVSFNRLEFRNLNNAPITDCKFQGGNISSRKGLIFTNCEVNIDTYEQRLGPNGRPLNPLIIENGSIFKASLIESSIQNNNSTVDVGTLYTHIGGIENNNSGLIKGNYINAEIKNQSSSTIAANEIYCRTDSSLQSGTYLIGKTKITCDDVVDIFCDMDAPTIVISGGVVHNSASLTGTINIGDSAVFAGTNNTDGEINFYGSQLNGGIVYNANFYEDSQFFNGIMYDGTMNSGSFLGGNSRFTRPQGFPIVADNVVISGEIEMNETTIDTDVSISGESNISIIESSTAYTSLSSFNDAINNLIFTINHKDDPDTIIVTLEGLSNDIEHIGAIDAAKISFGCDNPTSSYECYEKRYGISDIEISDQSVLSSNFYVKAINCKDSTILNGTISVVTFDVTNTSLLDITLDCLSAFALEAKSRAISSILYSNKNISILGSTANCTISANGDVIYEGAYEFPPYFAFDKLPVVYQDSASTIYFPKITNSSMNNTQIMGYATIKESLLNNCGLINSCLVESSWIINPQTSKTDSHDLTFNSCFFFNTNSLNSSSYLTLTLCEFPGQTSSFDANVLKMIECNLQALLATIHVDTFAEIKNNTFTAGSITFDGSLIKFNNNLCQQSMDMTTITLNLEFNNNTIQGGTYNITTSNVESFNNNNIYNSIMNITI